MIPRIMGIVNVTPDSFSDGGQFVDPDRAVAHARQLVAEGADIVDVGGESTRPGADPVSLDEELRRTVPVVAAVAADGHRVSIDTRHAEVAVAAVDVGASIINDVSASLGLVAAELGVGWIAMHMAGEPTTMQSDPRYSGDVVHEVRDYLVERADAARAAGAPEIWIDPGIGFGKTVEHNVDLVANLADFVATGERVALGVSRKSSLGTLTADADGSDEPTPVGDRLDVSLAMSVWAMADGVDLLRVHDVAAHVDALQGAEEILDAARG